MRATFEHGGTIIDIGNKVCDGLDTTGSCASSPRRNDAVALSLYHRDMVDPKIVRYASGFFMKPSEARAMASAILSAATEAKAHIA